MYFHIMNKDNRPVISGDLVLMRPHTVCSEINKTLCFLVYMHDVEINHEEFPVWAEKHLKCNYPKPSGGKPATSDYDYIEFSLGEFRDDYDFMITDRRMGSGTKRTARTLERT
jgi:hypothetical protein